MSFLEIDGLAKSYGAVRALIEANMSAEQGTIHGLCGANGAGKSTLIKILAGAISPDAGTILVGGEPLTEFSPSRAMQRGIGIVYQELALVPGLSIWQNVFLGVERRAGPLPRIGEMKARTTEILKDMGVDLDPETRVGDLPLPVQQIVEIAKAVCRGTSVLILDEPTAILNAEEKLKLFAIMDRLRNRGICIIFITHFIDELFNVCDVLTVMRDGRTVMTVPTSETTHEAIIEAMVGAVADYQKPVQIEDQPGTPVLRLRGASDSRGFADVGFDLRAGEVLGLAGLVGSGCYEVARALFGVRPLVAGTLEIEGKPVRFKSPRDAVRHGIGYIPEDRRGKGLCLNLSSQINVVLPTMGSPRFSRFGILSRRRVRAAFEQTGRDLDLHPLDPRLPAGNFSGGNQQKLVIGKWILRGCRVYVLVEPTRGVDIRAKAQIWSIVEKLRQDNAAVILVSTDFDDIAATCSRCLVFVDGRITAELKGEEVTSERLSSAAVALRRPAEHAEEAH